MDARLLNVRLRFALPACSQVYDAAYPQLAEQHVPVGVSGIGQWAASEQQPRRDHAAFADRDPAKIADVLHAL